MSEPTTIYDFSPSPGGPGVCGHAPTHPEEIERLTGATPYLSLEIERAIQLLTDARFAAQQETEPGKRAIALVSVAGGWLELARVTGAAS